MTIYETSMIAVSGIAAFLSAIIAILAVWGEPIRYKVSGPRLRLELRNSHGELLDGSEGKARYYHLRVSNQRRFVAARNVVVNLIQLDRPAPGGQGWTVDYETGPIPLAWQFSAYYVGPSDIGKDRYCDLGYIQESQGFAITPKFSPVGFNGRLKGDERMRVHLIAEGDNVKSEPLLLELTWNGKWHEGTHEMEKCFLVKVVKDFESRNG